MNVADRPTLEQVQARSAKNREAWGKLGKTRHSSIEAEWADRQVANPTRNPASGPPGKTAGRKTGRSTPDYEDMLCQQLRLAGITGWRRQYPFAPGRKYRADLCFIHQNLLIEIDGAVHRIKARFKADIERDQVIFFAGYRKLRISTAQVRSGEAVTLIKRALRISSRAFSLYECHT